MSFSDEQQIMVKNTFLHMDIGQEHPTRRCSSVPASSRLAFDSGAGKLGSGKLLRAESWEEVSTESGFSEDDNDVESVLSGQTRPSPAFHVDKNERDGMPNRTALNSRAKAWTPMAVTSSPRPCDVASEILQRLVAVVSAAAAALASTGFVLKAAAHEELNGWRIVARIRPQELRLQEHLLALAQAALLHAAEASGNIYVLGYLVKPFDVTPEGFKATLGVMPDQRTACWGAFSKSCCRHGSACKWQHPTCRTLVNVVVEVENL